MREESHNYKIRAVSNTRLCLSCILVPSSNLGVQKSAWFFWKVHGPHQLRAAAVEEGEGSRRGVWIWQKIIAKMRHQTHNWKE